MDREYLAGVEMRMTTTLMDSSTSSTLVALHHSIMMRVILIHLLSVATASIMMVMD